METNIETTIRAIHILSGVIALMSGLAALFLSGTTRRHKPIGKVFFYAMTSVFVTAIILSIQNGIDFLFCIAVLSFFSVVIGIRALRFLKGAKPSWVDGFAVTLLGLAGSFLAGKGVLAAMNQINGGIILYLLFGGGMLFYAFMTASELIRTKPGSLKWFTLHKSNMGAALIATITAFSTTTMDFLPSILPWIWPTLVLSPLLSFYIRKSNQLPS